MNRKRKDDLIAGAMGLASVSALVVIVIGVILLRMQAPCSWVDWLPAAEMPGRCLPGGR